MTQPIVGNRYLGLLTKSNLVGYEEQATDESRSILRCRLETMIKSKGPTASKGQNDPGDSRYYAIKLKIPKDTS